MAYCIFRLKKVKTKAVLNQMYSHHYRTSIPDNVDPSMTHLNDKAVDAGDKGFTYAFNQRLKQLEYYDTHTFRKNGVMAYDIVFEYSPDAAKSLDVDAWKKSNVEWLQNIFGKENVVSVVYHYDEASYKETGAIHGHAMVIPVDDKGKINARYYTGDRFKLSALQDSYAKAMEEHGLERGLKNSTALHTDIRRYYTKLTNAIYGAPMPEQKPGEADRDYVARVKESWRDERAAHVRELDEKDRQLVEIRAQYKSDEQKDHELMDANKKVRDLEEEKEELVREFGSYESAVESARAMQLINYAIDNYPDEAVADRLSDTITRFIEWSDERMERPKKDKDKSKENSEQESVSDVK